MSAVGFLQRMVIKATEVYWENLESSAPGLFIKPLCKMPSMASKKKTQTITLLSDSTAANSKISTKGNQKVKAEAE